MAGTFVTDALKTNLLAGGTLDLAADATTETYGAALQVNAPGPVLFHLTVDDPGASDDATITVAIQGCETSDFSTSDVVHIATYDTIAEAAGNTDVTNGHQPYELGPIYVGSKYIRAAVSVNDGTSGDYAGSTLYMEPPSYKLEPQWVDSVSNPNQPSAGTKA